MKEKVLIFRSIRNVIHELREVTKRESRYKHIRNWDHMLTGKCYMV